ncbi:uncharacterized protein LOC110852812 isoform X2 [Folsomia candida]|uniref:uncharacterized protein LOC110852812 isoform X2 n=1 Tax=Folsomia candida TaxID=158441 RepID=UPI001604FC7B|nr:uncharacterized protein LOC110852812 isoform X2 [Folsomia candida]
MGGGLSENLLPLDISEWNLNFVVQALSFNMTALSEDGFSFDELNCCYKIVTRVEQSIDKFDSNAENLISYSECTQIRNTTTDFSGQDKAEYIMVECSSSGMVLPNLIKYRGYHAIAQPSRSAVTANKIKQWETYREDLRRENKVDTPPPNIIVIGLDTTSRLNLRRNMIKSVETLERLGAVEMKGYTKAGEHTRQAMCSMLSGYAEDDLQCKINDVGGYDRCPFIWKRLTEAGYLTAYSEDWPDMYAFGTAGFIHQPVDYYIRTLLNAAHDYGLPFPVNQFVRLSTRWCIGSQTNDELLLDYTEALLEMSNRSQTPLFAMSWSDVYPHSMDHNMIQLLDPTYADFLTRLEQKGLLDNTILLFLSDHGQRYGPFRSTLIGWYEDKLPTFWIRLPPRLREKYPDWQIAMEINSKRLSSPFLFYWTINFILDHFRPQSSSVFSSNTNLTIPLKPPALVRTANETNIPRKFNAHHFFKEIPAKVTCEEVGVPEVFCACNPLKQIDLEDPLLVSAGKEVLRSLSTKLPKICAILDIGYLNGGAMIENMSSNKVTYIVGIVSQPGNMQIEANIDYFKDTKSFSETSQVQRANQINQNDIKCLNGNSTFQLYCYCIR